MAQQWSKPAKSKRTKLKTDFTDDLSGIAEHLAHHEHAASVSEAHVERAYQSLILSGLARRGFWDRPEAETSLGAFIVGLSFACPDLVSVFAPESYQGPVSAGFFFAFFTIGTLLAAHGWHRGRLPKPPSTANSWSVWALRITLVSLACVAVGTAIYFGLLRLSGKECPGCEPGEDAPQPVSVDADEDSVLAPNEINLFPEESAPPQL